MNVLKTSLTVLIAAVAVLLPGYGKTPVSTETGDRRISTFDSKDIERNPFLPIGWQMKTVIKGNLRRPVVTPEDFRVTSIVAGGNGAGLAIINGRGYAVGETVMVSVGGSEVGIRVKHVRDGHVVFWHNGEEITAKLINHR